MPEEGIEEGRSQGDGIAGGFEWQAEELGPHFQSLGNLVCGGATSCESPEGECVAAASPPEPESRPSSRAAEGCCRRAASTRNHVSQTPPSLPLPCEACMLPPLPRRTRNGLSRILKFFYKQLILGVCYLVLSSSWGCFGACTCECAHVVCVGHLREMSLCVVRCVPTVCMYDVWGV